jgi:hypothetical protein
VVVVVVVVVMVVVVVAGAVVVVVIVVVGVAALPLVEPAFSTCHVPPKLTTPCPVARWRWLSPAYR